MNTHKFRPILVIALLILPYTMFAENNNSIQFGENWSVSWEFVADTIEFTMIAPTTGWIAIGFNPSRMMKDASYVLSYVDEGKVFIREDFGTGNTSHRSDLSLGGSEMVKALSFKEEPNKTTITFSLPLDSKDAYDTVFVQGKTYTMLSAYGRNNAKNFTSIHRKRASAKVIL